jgi:pyruvate ferredoxin oxidoreductase alpha subunit
MLDFSRPVTYGAQTEEDWHYEHKANQHHALMESYKVIDKVFEEFKNLTGREYKRVESYLMDDAEIAIVALGSSVETAIVAAKELRKEGIKAGIVSPRCFRPFPYNEIQEALKDVKAVGALDRALSMGTMGVLFNEVAGALYSSNTKPILTNYIYGLGGRDFSVNDAKQIFKELKANADAGKATTPLQQFSGLRGGDKIAFYEWKRS